MSSPPGPKISASATTSNFSAAVTRASAACFGVSKVLPPAEESVAVFAGTVLGAEACAGNRVGADKHAQTSAHKTEAPPGTRVVAIVELISAPCISLPCALAWHTELPIYADLRRPRNLLHHREIPCWRSRDYCFHARWNRRILVNHLRRHCGLHRRYARDRGCRSGQPRHQNWNLRCR